MSSLPDALRPWASQLSLFPEDLALSLGAHVARLAAAIGPMRARNEVVGGELQGYDGLTRRGSPERLLISEWLMAMEAPDEFVRRAAFGEQAYLKPAFRQPQGGRRAVALLDAGPDQLGAPRIAHLALLVVLARRAEAAGVGFSWGVLQAPPRKVPFTTVDASSIGQWLKAGSVVPPTGEQLAAWREALELGHAPDDVWLVGGSRLSRLPGAEGLSRVAVEEAVAPGDRRLTVEVRPASRPSREVLLELPPEPQCVRLLRDPFAAAVAAPVLDTRASTVRSIRFSADGLRLLFAYGDGSVAAQALPQSPRATTPKPKRFQPPRGETVVAMGWRRNGGLLTVTRLGETLRVHGPLQGVPNGRRVSLVSDDAAPPRLPQAGELPLLVTSMMGRTREAPVLLDGAGMLYHLGDWDADPPKAVPMCPGSSVVEHRGALLSVGRSPRMSEGARGPLMVQRQGPRGNWRYEVGVEGDGEAYLGGVKDSTSNEPPGLLLAVRQQPGSWRLLRNVRDPGTELSVPAGMRVVGLFSGPPGTEGLGLVTLGPDERSLYLVTGHGEPDLLLTAPARVLTATVSHSQPLLAWLTEKGQVGAWSFQYRDFVFHSTPGGNP
jgi:hypothetical protein